MFALFRIAQRVAHLRALCTTKTSAVKANQIPMNPFFSVPGRSGLSGTTRYRLPIPFFDRALLLEQRATQEV